MRETAKTRLSAARALQSGEFDADFDWLNELWQILNPDDRVALVAHAEHLAALRDG
ncbi:MAG: hypothetical protein JSS49_13375 [Planctomycetes bacterium]|nr:hypothetical protein [Planctomycetota bacterium]